MTLWADLASPDLAAAAARADRGQEVGLVPVGATEQHGPHLPTGTDTIVAGALCDAVGERTGALVLPAIPLGVSYGHGTVLPGTLSLTPELLVAARAPVRALGGDLGAAAAAVRQRPLRQRRQPRHRHRLPPPVRAATAGRDARLVGGRPRGRRRGHRRRRRHPRQPGGDLRHAGHRARPGAPRPGGGRRRPGPHRRARLPLHRAGAVDATASPAGRRRRPSSSASGCSTGR